MLLAKGSVPSPRTWWMIQSGSSCACLTFVMGFTCHYSVSNDKPVPDSEAFVETSEGWMVDLSSSLVVVGLELWQEEFKCFCSSNVKILSSHFILVFGFLCSGKHHAVMSTTFFPLHLSQYLRTISSCSKAQGQRERFICSKSVDWRCFLEL